MMNVRIKAVHVARLIWIASMDNAVVPGVQAERVTTAPGSVVDEGYRQDL